jgi:hypothetical protein
MDHSHKVDQTKKPDQESQAQPSNYNAVSTITTEESSKQDSSI